ncbi:hypothetical protein IEQ34_004980 [Dendrobium chrysotoxum]|uniref:Uncharacterized protein n=1 Tax=Dendrobium chrysotoxum TaxID=161865 RepID=A0AAV7H7A0_DENCH|nr:hypothetical protein IEQ34_004980 [Dendrobium chrysotoxum]
MARHLDELSANFNRLSIEVHQELQTNRGRGMANPTARRTIPVNVPWYSRCRIFFKYKGTCINVDAAKHKQQGINCLPLGNCLKHLVELLPRRSHLLSGEEGGAQLLPDKPIKRIRPAFLNPVPYGRRSILKSHSYCLHLLWNRSFDLLFKSCDLLEDGRVGILLFLTIVEGMLNQHLPQILHQRIGRAAGVIRIGEHILPFNHCDQNLEGWSSPLIPTVRVFFAARLTAFFTALFKFSSKCLKSMAWQIATRKVLVISFSISTASAVFLDDINPKEFTSWLCCSALCTWLVTGFARY